MIHFQFLFLSLSMSLLKYFQSDRLTEATNIFEKGTNEVNKPISPTEMQMCVDFYKKSQDSMYNKKSIFGAEYQPLLNNIK